MTFTRRSLLAALVASAMVVTPGAAQAAAPGQLHPLFAPFAERVGTPEGDESATGIAIAPSGRIVASILNDVEIDRRIVALNPDGSRDLTFSEDGTWSLPQANETLIRGVAVQPDGKTVFVGDDASTDNIVVGRLMIDGELDPTFGAGNGLAVIGAPAEGSQPRAEQVLLQPDGRILFAGSLLNGTRGRDIFIGRLTPAGTDDSSFAGSALFRVYGSTPNNDNDLLAGLVRMANGELVVASSHDMPSTGIWRIGPNGEWSMIKDIDLVNTIDKPIDLAAVSSTQVMAIVTGTPWTTALARFDVANTPKLDTTFGTGGIATPFPSSFLGQQIARQPDGSFVVAGISNAPTLHRAVARVTAAGALDTSFGAGGIAHLDGASAYSAALRMHELALDVDGSILLGSHVGTSGTRATTVDRLVGRIARLRAEIVTPTPQPTAGVVANVIIRAINDGPDDAGATAISFALSADLELRGATGAVCLYQGANGGICRFDSLAAGSSREVTLHVRSAAPGARGVSVQVAGTTWDDDAANDSTSTVFDFAAAPPSAAAKADAGAKQPPSSKAGATKLRKLKLTIQRIRRMRGKAMRCGQSIRRACVTTRVRAGRGTVPMFVRASSRPNPGTAKRTIDVTIQRRQGRRFVTKGGGDLGLTRRGRVDFKLPTDMRGKASVWRIRTHVKRTATTRAARSAWFYVRVR